MTHLARRLDLEPAFHHFEGRPALLLVREERAAYGRDEAPRGCVRPGAPDSLGEVDGLAALDGPDAAPPDPFDDADALEELGDEIATLAAHIHAATHRLLVLVADFDRRRGWRISGHRSCAHWLAFRTGIHLGAAREKVRTARVLVGLPETSAAMARGELSFSKVRALSRIATPDNERDLLDLARGSTTAQLERTVRAWRRTSSRMDEVGLERERLESRAFSIFPDLDGMYVVRGKLPPEMGLLLMRAIDAASDRIYREGRPAGGEGRATGGEGRTTGGDGRTTGGDGHRAGGDPSSTDRPQLPDPHEAAEAAARRRADALLLLAERAMAAGLGAEESPVSGTRAERYQVVLHVDEGTLRADGRDDAAAVSHLDDGTRVSAETSRRLACDVGLVRMRHAPDGRILGVGRRTRTISPALRRALEARDRGCRFPGCGSRFTDAHHVRHWADGGPTSLANTLLLCRHHHMLLHEGGWRIEWWGEGRPAFFGPRGGMHFEGRWQPPELPAEPVHALIDEHRAGGVVPTGETASARWRRDCDVPLEIYLTAAEAAISGSPARSSPSGSRGSTGRAGTTPCCTRST